MTIAIEALQNLKDQAKDFRGLMDLYEANYIRFHYLVDDLGNLEDESLSIRRGDINLHLQILERCKYTTTVLLTYRSEVAGQTVRTPDMKIRLYHDARQAEVMSCCRHEMKQYKWLDRASCTTNIQWRWRLNHFLFKWLIYCLKMGHGFPQQKSGINWSNLQNSLKA